MKFKYNEDIMPTYAYKCEDCSEKYEIFFKVREDAQDIKCPKCNSLKYKKIMSVTSIGSATTGKAGAPQCGTGCCPGCSLN